MPRKKQAFVSLIFVEDPVAVGLNQREGARNKLRVPDISDWNADGITGNSDLSEIRVENAREDVQESAFARAVFAQQGMNFAGFHPKGSAVQGPNPGKRLSDVF